MREGLVLALLTHAETLTADPAGRRRALPGRARAGADSRPQPLPSGPQSRTSITTPFFPYVQNVHLRDTGLAPGEFQVRVGQGQIEYARIVTLLQRYGYNRSLTVAIIDRPDNPFDREVELRKLKLLLETLDLDESGQPVTPAKRRLARIDFRPERQGQSTPAQSYQLAIEQVEVPDLDQGIGARAGQAATLGVEGQAGDGPAVAGKVKSQPRLSWLGDRPERDRPFPEPIARACPSGENAMASQGFPSLG